MTALARYLLISIVRLLIGARSAWFGAKPSPVQRIYFANHASHFDTLAVMASLPADIRARTRPVAARDYWGKTRLRRFIAEDCLRCVLIDRTRGGTEDPLAPVLRVLGAGDSILIFPEGTRGSGETMAEFKSGLFNLARQFPQVELVPVFLDNLARIMPKGSVLIVPITCTARFGAPLSLQPDEDRLVFLDRARRAVAALAEDRGRPRTAARP